MNSYGPGFEMFEAPPDLFPFPTEQYPPRGGSGMSMPPPPPPPGSGLQPPMSTPSQAPLLPGVQGGPAGMSPGGLPPGAGAGLPPTSGLPNAGNGLPSAPSPLGAAGDSAEIIRRLQQMMGQGGGGSPVA